MRTHITSFRPKELSDIEAVEHGVGYPDTSDTFVIAFIDDKPVGYLVANNHECIVCIHAVYVLSDYRKRGVATALINAVKGIVGVEQELQLDCFAHNRAAYSLYTTLGFEPYFVTMKCGRPNVSDASSSV